MRAHDRLLCPHCAYDVARTVADDIERCPECGGALDEAAFKAVEEAPETKPANFVFFVFMCAWIGGFFLAAADAATRLSIVSGSLLLIGGTLLLGPTLIVARSAASVGAGVAHRPFIQTMLLYTKVMLMMLPAILVGYGLARVMS